jgi:hypothetical protein
MEHDSIQFDSPLPVVMAWQDAANLGDLARLLELSDPDIEMSGPQGHGRGRDLLRDWLARAGLSLQTQHAFVRGETVVLAQHGTWRAQQTGEAAGEADLATTFRVNDGRVVQLTRYDSLGAALADTKLDASDEMKDF